MLDGAAARSAAGRRAPERAGRDDPRGGRRALSRTWSSERLGSLAASDDPFVARNDAAWRGGAFVYVPAGKRLEMPAQIAAVHDADNAALGFRTLIVLEEWRRGRGLGAVARHRPRAGRPLQHGHRDPGRPRRQPALRHRPGPGRKQLGLRHPARRGRARRDPRLGRARLRLLARQGADGDPAGGPGLHGPGDRRLRRQRQPAPRLRHHPGARRPQHHLRPRLPRGSGASRRRRSGAA